MPYARVPRLRHFFPLIRYDRYTTTLSSSRFPCLPHRAPHSTYTRVHVFAPFAAFCRVLRHIGSSLLIFTVNTHAPGDPFDNIVTSRVPCGVPIATNPIDDSWPSRPRRLFRNRSRWPRFSAIMFVFEKSLLMSEN